MSEYNSYLRQDVRACFKENSSLQSVSSFYNLLNSSLQIQPFITAHFVQLKQALQDVGFISDGTLRSGF